MQTGHVVDYRGNLLNMSNLGRLPVTAEAVSRRVLFTLAPTVSLTQLAGLVEHSSTKLNIQGCGSLVRCCRGTESEQHLPEQREAERHLFSSWLNCICLF